MMGTVGKRLEGWKKSLSSKGCKLTSMQLCLSSIPTFPSLGHQLVLLTEQKNIKRYLMVLMKAGQTN